LEKESLEDSSAAVVALALENESLADSSAAVVVLEWESELLEQTWATWSGVWWVVRSDRHHPVETQSSTTHCIKLRADAAVGSFGEKMVH
jgi:hypothetical protein